MTLVDKSRHEAEILAVDEANDLALIRIRAERDLPSLNLGQSTNLKVGQKVLAIGNPFGFEGTLTTGVISSLGRSLKNRTGQPRRGLAMHFMDARMPDPDMLKILPEGATPLLRGSAGPASAVVG